MQLNFYPINLANLLPAANVMLSMMTSIDRFSYAGKAIISAPSAKFKCSKKQASRTAQLAVRKS